MPPQAWFKAVLLLDAYTQRKDPLAKQHAPTLYVAIVSTLVKFEPLNKKDAQELLKFSSTSRLSIVDEANSLVRHFQDQGHVGMTGLTVEMLKKQERDLLITVDWNLGVPSVYTWAKFVCERLNVISRNKVSTSINFLLAFVLHHAAVVLVQGPDVGDIPPRRLTHGLVVLGLVVARLLDLQTLCPAEVKILDFDLVFRKVFCYRDTMPQCAVPSIYKEPMFELVVVASCVQAHELRRDAYVVATKMWCAGMGHM